MRRARQAGFTVIELMVALTISLLLMVVLFGLWLDAIHNTAWVNTQVNLNRQAREMFDMLAFGRRVEGMNVKVPVSPYTVNSAAAADYNYVFGLRGRHTTTTSTSGFDAPCSGATGGTDCLMAKSGDATPVALYRLVLPSNGLSTADEGPPAGALISEAVLPIALSCAAAGEPLVECTSSGGTLTANGFLRGAPAFALVDNGVLGGVREITLPLIDPWATNNPELSLYQISEVYWTAFNLYVQ